MLLSFLAAKPKSKIHSVTQFIKKNSVKINKTAQLTCIAFWWVGLIQD